MRKTSKTSGKSGRQFVFYLNGQRPTLSQAERAVMVGWVPPNSDSLYGGEAATAVCAHVCAHSCARVSVSTCACVMCLQYMINIFDPG